MRRTVATRCLFGVDRDPLAVACARAALWLAVGDPALSLRALEAQLRCGDALLGVGPDEAQDYPLSALGRARPGRDTGLSALRAQAAGDRGTGSGRPRPGLRPVVCPVVLAVVGPVLASHARGVGTPSGPAAPRPGRGGPAPLLSLALAFLTCSRAMRRALTPCWAAPLGDRPATEFFSVTTRTTGPTASEALQAQQALFAARPALDAAWQAHQDAVRGGTSASTALDSRAPPTATPTSCSGAVPGAVAAGWPAESGGAGCLRGRQGCHTLRQHLLEQCRWRWLYGFDNRDQLFAIEGRFSFCVVIAETHGQTDVLQAASGQTHWTDWEVGRGAVFLSASLLRALSPTRLAVLPLADRQDLDLLQHLVAHGLPVEGPEGWGLRYARELDMTTDSGAFVDPRAAGDGSGHLPLVQGVMLGPRRFNRVGHVSGRGLSARWEDLGPSDPPRPQFYVAAETAGGTTAPFASGSGHRAATDTRTLVAALVPPWPCGNNVGLVLPDRRQHRRWQRCSRAWCSTGSFAGARLAPT